MPVPPRTPSRSTIPQSTGQNYGSGPSPSSRQVVYAPPAPQKVAPQNPQFDFLALAREMASLQNQQLDRQTQANRPNINTPFGHQSWTQDANGNWSLQSGFAPGMQGAADALMKEFGGYAGKPFDFNAGRQEAEDALYSRQMMRLNPEFQTREAQMQAQLGAAGYSPASSAYRAATKDLAAERVGAGEAARLNAIAGGGAEAARNFGMQMQARQMPLMQLGQMHGLTGAPGFHAAGQGQGPNLLGAAQMGTGFDLQRQQMAMQKAMQDQASGADWASGAMGLAGSILPFLMFSDERLKRDVVRLESGPLPGVPWATWEYRFAPGRRHVGVIAQDLVKVRPEAVVRGPGGFLMVDYSFLAE